VPEVGDAREDEMKKKIIVEVPRWFNFRFSADWKWYRGNPWVGLTFEIWQTTEDFPSGISMVRIIGINFLKFSFALYVSKGG
jgi:hypothetical protein